VHRAHVLDGRIPHALLLEFFTREGIGTMVSSDVVSSDVVSSDL
jgi:acetylglutamate kinase